MVRGQASVQMQLESICLYFGHRTKGGFQYQISRVASLKVLQPTFYVVRDSDLYRSRQGRFDFLNNVDVERRINNDRKAYKLLCLSAEDLSSAFAEFVVAGLSHLDKRTHPLCRPRYPRKG